MSAKEKFLEMVSGAKGAIEDFNDFAEDRALAWAGDEIKRLTTELTTAHSNGYREGAEAMRKAAVEYHESRMQMWKESGFPAAAHMDAHETSIDAIRALPLLTAPDTAKEEGAC